MGVFILWKTEYLMSFKLIASLLQKHTVENMAIIEDRLLSRIEKTSPL